MNLTLEADYAIRIVNCLATTKKRLDAKTISEQSCVSLRFSLKILRKLVTQILDAGKGATTEIKLLKNTKGEPTFPGYFAGITKESKAYIRNNFIGSKLAFTTYEAQRIQNEANAKPIAVKSYSAPLASAPGQESEATGVNIEFDMPIL